MNRNIFFDEFTPLNFKPEIETSRVSLQAMFFFEILLVGCGLFVLSRLEETCDQIPMGFWVSIMVVLVNFHLILAGIEMFLNSFQVSLIGWPVHLTCTGFILSWMVYGNYLILFQGLSCLSNQDYLISSIFMATLDILSILTILYYSCTNHKLPLNNSI